MANAQEQVTRAVRRGGHGQHSSYRLLDVTPNLAAEGNSSFVLPARGSGVR